MSKTINIPEDFNLVSHLSVKRDKDIFIWLFNIGAEKYWNRLPAAALDRNEEAIVNRIEEINLLLCRSQDYLILRQQPDPCFLEALKELGFTLPHILTVNTEDPYIPVSELILKDAVLPGRLKEIASTGRTVYLMPYGVTHLEEELAAHCGLVLGGAASGITARINDKIFCREILTHLGYAAPSGKICTSTVEIKEAYHALSVAGFKQVIIKEPCNASGKGLYLVEKAEMLDPLLPRLQRFSRKLTNPCWLVEGWYEKQKDINYQIYISPGGDITLFSLKEQILRQTVYIGSRYPAALGEEQRKLYTEYAHKIGKYLHKLGYFGIAGIDSIITADNEVFPAIEINGRFTLSTYISFITEQLGATLLYLARYFKIITGKSMNYAEFTDLLKKQGLIFTKQKGEGVFVYSSGTLPSRLIPDSNLFAGRIFCLIIAEDRNRLEHYNSALEKLLDGIARHISS